MSLMLVRHGQASFGSDDYDRLSPVGHDQARRLGAWLAGHQRRPAHVICGGMRRHRETWDGMRDGWADASGPLPDAESMPALDEFDHRAVIGAFLAEQPDHPAAALMTDAGRPDPHRVLDLLVSALSRWARGGDVGGSESWAAFRDRTTGTLQRIDELARDGEVWVVSSGGVISQLARFALQAPEETAVRLNLGLRNSALSELKPHGGHWHLHSWNELPHLSADRGQWTYF